MSATVPSIAPAPAEAREFRPIFVVGCQRSGTTALAVMLDRHPEIAMMAETHFLCSWMHRDRRRGGPMTHEALLDRALADFFIKETQPDRRLIAEVFGNYPADYPHLLRAMMQAHVIRQGKTRPAEKSCDHLFHAEEIVRLYPQARIICIERDGRDVVSSIRKLGWGGVSGLPGLCRQWNAFIRQGRKLARTLSPEVYTTVRFEDLMTQPEQELRRLCRFLGVEFVPAQLESSADTAVVPQYELDWKGKAKERPDPARIAAWKRSKDPMLVQEMNFYMGDALRTCGYPEAEVIGVPLGRRLRWAARYFPHRRGIHPLTRAVMRVARGLRLVEKTPEISEVLAQD